jgi:hypothetical protein
MAPAPDGHLEAERPGELHGVGHVGRAPAAGDEGRPLVDEAIVDAARLVIGGIGRHEELSGERGRKLGDRGRERHGHLRSRERCGFTTS